MYERVIYCKSLFFLGIDRDFLISDLVLIKMKFIFFGLYGKCIDFKMFFVVILFKSFVD